jgi:hypothetical protein
MYTWCRFSPSHLHTNKIAAGGNAFLTIGVITRGHHLSLQDLQTVICPFSIFFDSERKPKIHLRQTTFSVISSRLLFHHASPSPMRDSALVLNVVLSLSIELQSLVPCFVPKPLGFGGW